MKNKHFHIAVQSYNVVFAGFNNTTWNFAILEMGLFNYFVSQTPAMILWGGVISVTYWSSGVEMPGMSLYSPKSHYIDFSRHFHNL